MVIASRLLSASERRPTMSISPTMRHSSVTPSNGTPRPDRFGAAVGSLADAAASGLRLRRKSNGTLLLRRAGVLADRLDHTAVREGRRVAERPALADVA